MPCRRTLLTAIVTTGILPALVPSVPPCRVFGGMGVAPLSPRVAFLHDLRTRVAPRAPITAGGVKR